MDSHTTEAAVSGVKKQDTILNGLLGVVLVASLATIILRGQAGGASDAALAASLFESSATFGDVVRQSEAEDKPVFVFATADWCGPCQSFKGRVLADGSVQDNIRSQAVPYLLDLTQSVPSDPEDQRLAAKLSVTSLPSYFLITGDEVVAKGSGAIAKADFVSWFEAGSAPAGQP
ncbi:MAG: thioredoxin fold domain-containing protein [Planctomycetota bacterium]